MRSMWKRALRIRLSASAENLNQRALRYLQSLAVSGKGVKELLYEVYHMLQGLDQAPVIFEKEFDTSTLGAGANLPYTIEINEDGEYVVEGPRIEKMLGYTNLESEKGFVFFQKFMKDTGILDELEKKGIQEGDTVRMYGFVFDYYK